MNNYLLFLFHYIFSLDLFHYVPPFCCRHSETLLNTCIAHSNSADLLLSHNASGWLSGDFYNKNQ